MWCENAGSPSIHVRMWGGGNSKTDIFKMHKGFQKHIPSRGASSNAAGTRPGTKWATGGCGTLEIHSLFWVFLSAGPPGP